MRRSLVVVVSAAAMLAACSRQEPRPEPVRSVRTMLVTSSVTSGQFEYAGEVKARTESRLGFRVGGKIVRRSVSLGDVVKAGQVLAQLDPEDLKLGQEAARAGVQAAKASLDQVTADYKRFKELRDQGFISSAELERRETALKSAQAQFEQARAQASVQGNQAAYSSLVADASGVITGVDAEPGMVVSAGAPVVRLAHDGPRDVVFAVPEDKVAVIKSLAQQADRLSVRLWGDAGEVLPATVREIAAAADPVTRTFLVKADVGQAASKKVRLGQTATVSLELPPTEGVTKLPLSALKEEGGRTVVWVVDASTMTVQPQAIEVAGAEGDQVVLKSGLKAGQTIVTAGVHVLTPGQKVKFYAEPRVDAGSAAAASNRTPAGVK